MSDARSCMQLGGWRGDLTVLRSLKATRPLREHLGISWSEVVDLVAPAAGVSITSDKTLVRYVLPCSLKTAPLVGKTLAKAIQDGAPTVGKQRSLSHANPARWAVHEFDGIHGEAFNQIGHSLKAAGIAFACWTSWSLGLVTKPGMRARLAFPVDESLDAAAYRLVWHGANQRFMLGLADGTGASLIQQQGVWAIGPERAHLARRWVVAGGVASAAALKALAPQDQAPEARELSTRMVREASEAPVEHRAQHAAAMSGIQAVWGWGDGPEVLFAWAGLAPRVRDGQGREAAILRLAGRMHAIGAPVEFVEAVCLAYNARCVEPELDENIVLDRVNRHAGSPWSPVAAFAAARDMGKAAARRAMVTGDWTPLRPALVYLSTHHRAVWRRLCEPRGGDGEGFTSGAAFDKGVVA